MLRWPGYGRKGDAGTAPNLTIGAVATGAPGSAATATITGTSPNYTLSFSIPQGQGGNPGLTPTLAIGTVTTLAAGASATASIGGTAPNYTVSFGIPQGAAGSSASATPLGAATPQPLGTAAAGSSSNASREDHVHPLPAGRLTLLGSVNVAETLLVSLAVGMKRMTLALSGVALGDKLLAIPNGTPSSGCEVVNAYPASAGNVSIGYYTPLLAIGASYSIPVSVYRIT